jgi:4-amino-4-deoxy-L-arabinose transferase-like glycosyltransferase
VKVRIPLALVLICVAGAALRFATLDVQSLWLDEAVTAHLLRLDLAGMWQAIPDSESTPPLYYVLAWLWTQLAGTGEVGMRSLSALLGTATVGVGWALGRRLGGDRAGLVAAALLAVNPMLVWFSQEARAYALLVLLAALSALLWLRLLERPGSGRGLAWALVAALALATHYYAIFLVAPQALWLLVRVPGWRARAAALAPLAVAGAALAPLALGQRANDSADFIGGLGLATRLAQVPKQLLVGYEAPAETMLAVLSAVVLAIAAFGLWRLLAERAPAREGVAARDDARRLTALFAAALLLPTAAALAGEDHLITRNLLAAAPLGVALAGAGLAAIAAARPRLGGLAIAAGCVLALVAVVGVDLDRGLQREDWRGAVHALGHATGTRVVVVSPADGASYPLEYYLPSARSLPPAGLVTAEIDALAIGVRASRAGARPQPPRPRPAPIPVPGFALAVRTEATTFTVLRLRAKAPQLVTPAAVATGLDGKPAAVVAGTR